MANYFRLSNVVDNGGGAGSMADHESAYCVTPVTSTTMTGIWVRDFAFAIGPGRNDVRVPLAQPLVSILWCPPAT
ncbi:hypothetical protein EGR_11289 [Echinococcus granulosus]|uniref:Uncharacterized protein n=1 Tax=Echinococcus granulosus TaxID=6210 RepID=W6TYI9_ECHGR|nr:hypothetical protein EGR_11289 [Echinococcus granulosus]EUB53860.1 hypothetical protein EGR_11289 [Echinococcus granulosus]